MVEESLHFLTKNLRLGRNRNGDPLPEKEDGAGFLQGEGGACIRSRFRLRRRLLRSTSSRAWGSVGTMAISALNCRHDFSGTSDISRLSPRSKARTQEAGLIPG